MTATDFSTWTRESLEQFARAATAQLAERSDTKRLDWLADVDNEVGSVLLPSEFVLGNIHSLRDAIDDAMRRHPIKRVPT